MHTSSRKMADLNICKTDICNMSQLDSLKREIRAKGNLDKSKLLMRFFKTGPGEYGEGDIFLGVMVPQTREVAKKYSSLPLKDIETLLKSKYHEERLCALLILVHNFQKHPENRSEIYKFYLNNTKYINNWDLVDLSAHKIIGPHLFDKNRSILYELAKSKNLWERRIAIISTFAFINKKEFNDSIKLATLLLKDKHDLMHKAVGWMLREMGKRDQGELTSFLDKHYKSMPRTMLRYSIERLPEKKRQFYLKS